MTGVFRRAPGGADDFLNADSGDKNDYDWWVLLLKFRAFTGGQLVQLAAYKLGPKLAIV